MPKVRASDLVQWRAGCRKKFEYKLARGWEVDDSGREASIGTAFHAGLAKWYKTRDNMEAIGAAGNSVLDTGLGQDEVNLVCDMINYFIENNELDIAEVLGTEVEMEMTFLCPMTTSNGPQMSPFTVTGHLDLVARDSQGQLLVIDHKTKKTMPGSYEWFQLSTQMKLYALMAWRQYGEVPKVIHNVVRQSVPPGFGHRSYVLKKDGTPSKRQASEDVNDYLRKFNFLKSEDALKFYEQDMRAMCGEIILAIMGAVRFERHEGILCERCPYLVACLREDAGEMLSDSQAKMLFETQEKKEEENGSEQESDSDQAADETG